MKIKQPLNTKMLQWNKQFAAQRNAQIQRAQAFIDAECLRQCDPLTPMKTGNLIKSGQEGTKIGSGEIEYTAPYARRMYYGEGYDFSKETHPQAGAKWFDRMKVSHKEEILRGAMDKMKD